MTSYPSAHRSDHVDRIHGVAVHDPYRRLENLDHPETQAWIAAQNRFTHEHLKRIPGREAIRTRMEALWDYAKYGTLTLPVPIKRGGRYFYTYNDGLRNQSALYWSERLTQDPLAGAHLLIDPNAMAADGTVALSWAVPSPNGRWVAYGTSSSGSDWVTWRVRDVDRGRDLDDEVRWSKFSTASWSKDSRGFFYSRYDEPSQEDSYKGANYYHKLYYHGLETPQHEDRLICERSDHKEWGFSGEVTEDGRFLVIIVWKGTHRVNGLFYVDLADPDRGVVELLRDFDASYEFLGNDGRRFYLRTNRDAPLGRIVALDLDRDATDAGRWHELVGQGSDVLVQAQMVADRLVLCYLRDACSCVGIFDLAGRRLADVDLPGLGTASGFQGTREDPETFFSYTDFVTPPQMHRLDVQSGAVRLFWRPGGAFDSDAFETRQVFYESKDGTRVPMFIAHRKGLEPDGERPVHLYGYGGFNNPSVPLFSVPNHVWMEMGGVYAQACLRGGGEYGKAWHEAGARLHKQNVFDDFIAAAEWLIDQRYTCRERLSIGGRSNGGLLVGACLVQRPDLYAACLPAVGVLDMLRFHKFTIGWAWTSDYGSPEVEEEFKALRAYSPYHNVREGTEYPATLVTTADHDDRVFPAHSFKFAAALQHAQAAPPAAAPILIRIDTKAGHGAGKPTAMVIAESADRWAFLVQALDMERPRIE